MASLSNQYKCRHIPCTRNYHNASKLRVHELSLHNGKSQCFDCGREFDGPSSFDAKSHGLKICPYKDPLQQEAESSSTNITTSLEELPKGTMVRCILPTCDNNIFPQTELKQHYEKKHPELQEQVESQGFLKDWLNEPKSIYSQGKPAPISGMAGLKTNKNEGYEVVRFGLP